MQENKLSPKQIKELALANKIKPLVNELMALCEKRGSGITLEKNAYIGERSKELEGEIDRLKAKQ